MKDLFKDKIKSKSALIFILLIMITEKYWLFGFLFLIWVILDLKNRQTFLLEIVQRNNNPILYWLIVLTWFIFAVLSFSNIVYY